MPILPSRAILGFDVHRIDALQPGIELEQLGQLYGDRIENIRIDTKGHRIQAHAPQGFLADVFGLVAWLVKVEGVVPLDVEKKLLDDLAVGQIMELLQDESPQYRIQILCGTALIAGESQCQLVHRQQVENIRLKIAGPLLIE
jgi:hypothetical protein